MQENTWQSTGRILTIPNLLSLVRIALIPPMVYAYAVNGDALTAVILLLISGATDILDGFIARHFDMISDLGKVLDPIADKLTQAAMLGCLAAHCPHMLLPLVLMVIKELFAIITGIMTVQRLHEVLCAEWHGKLATVVLHSMVFLHLVWYNIPAELSHLLVGVSSAAVLLSMILYGVRNIRIIVMGKKP